MKIGNVFRIFLFILTTATIIYLFPREGKFQFEFQKGAPWSHKTLISPFDFPIYKSVDDITKEKKDINNNIKYYFNLKKDVEITQLNLFKKEFEAHWEKHQKKFFGINFTKDSDNKAKNEYLNFTVGILKNIFKKGVISVPSSIKSLLTNETTIVIVKNNNAKEYELQEIFSFKTATDYLNTKIQNRRDKYTYSTNIDISFLEKLNLSKYIYANIFYDSETTKNIIEKKINNISLTQGMIQAGQKIIDKGEIVNEENFRKLFSLKKEYEESLGQNTSASVLILGQSILVILTILSVYLFLYHFRREIIYDTLKTSFILLFILLMISSTIFILKYTSISLYIIPFSILPIIIRTFYDARLSLFIHIITTLLIGFVVPNGYEFVYIQIIVGIAAIFSLANVQKRRQLFISAMIIFTTYSVVYFAMSILQEGDISKINFRNFAWFAGNGLLILLSHPLIYIFEKLFGFLSDATLLELSDTNSPLLRQLNENAPGTFQHTIQVANLAEDATYKIGGNPLLSRAGALYHDIGKLAIPQYFTENQMNGNNPHDLLEYDKSAEIIISHVKNGVEFAKKNKLPKEIIEFITTHHGSSKVQYFFRLQKKKFPDQEIDATAFTYPGKSPFTKEQAIVMICDSVEAASRSLKEITENSISNLVENIINFQISEKQFDNADITFKDITIIKTILKQKLKNIYHARIEYPKEE